MSWHSLALRRIPAVRFRAAANRVRACAVRENPHKRWRTSTVQPERRDAQACELADCEQLLGRWHYDGSMSYVISPLGDSACRFDEWDRLLECSCAVCLAVCCQHLVDFVGELFNQEQCFVGCLRLRYDAQRQVLISQCRPQHGDWGPETTAASHSSKLNQNDSSETRYVVMATLLCTGLVLLQDLTWRNSMRPLFVAIGLEDVADDIERWTKDCWSTVRKLSRGVS
eukprot:s1250_g2.t2